MAGRNESNGKKKGKVRREEGEMKRKQDGLEGRVSSQAAT